MNVEIYQVDISLISIEPVIWRQIEVPSDISMADFHKVIQVSMGWSNKYKHRFVKDMTFYAPTEEFLYEDYSFKEYGKLTLKDLLEVVKDKMIYNYDFKDNWAHEVILLKKLEADPNIKYPRIVDGEGNCPPERCGGVDGFYELMDILDNPKHMDYEDTIEWLGEDFDIDFFDLEESNKDLIAAF